MLISHRRQFIFIHIGKTAGTNLTRCLEPYADQPERFVVNRCLDRLGIHVNYLPPYRSKRFRRHATAAQVRRHLPARVYQDMFVFAFVRNPWTWMLSQYLFMLRNPLHHRHETVKKLGSFETYLQWEIERDRRSQHGFVTDRRGRVIVDFVGRFESIEQDFATVAQRIGLDGLELPGHHEGHTRDHSRHYTDRARELVARHFARDIEMFEYDYDGPLSSTAELNRRLTAEKTPAEPRVSWPLARRLPFQIQPGKI